MQGDWIDVLRVNGKNHSLPQNRPRVFFRGVGPRMVVTAKQRQCLATPPPQIPMRPLIEFLDPVTSNDFDTMNLNQQLNIMSYVEWFQIRYADTAKQPTLAIVDANPPLSYMVLNHGVTPRSFRLFLHFLSLQKGLKRPPLGRGRTP